MREDALGAFWRALGDQLRNPSGLVGRLTGSLMGVVNAKPNALAIAALGIRDGESLLELGCGPGYALKCMSILGNALG